MWVVFGKEDRSCPMMARSVIFEEKVGQDIPADDPAFSNAR